MSQTTFMVDLEKAVEELREINNTPPNNQFAIMDEMHTYRSDKFYDTVKANISKKKPIKVYVYPGRRNGKTNFQLEMNKGEKDMHIGSKGVMVYYNGHKYWARHAGTEFCSHPFPHEHVSVTFETTPAFLVDDNDTWDTLKIKDVIFNPPATIVFWSDGDKTVVKCQDEEFDPEKGLSMAIARKFLGNKYDYYNVFKKWLKRAPKKED